MVDAVHNSRFWKVLLMVAMVTPLAAACTIADPGPRPDSTTSSDADTTAADGTESDTSAPGDVADTQVSTDSTTQDTAAPEDSGSSPTDTSTTDAVETSDSLPADADAAPSDTLDTSAPQAPETSTSDAEVEAD